jgi:hypothetical protein
MTLIPSAPGFAGKHQGTPKIPWLLLGEGDQGALEMRETENKLVSRLEAYTIIRRLRDDWWVKIGTASISQSGDRIDIRLHAIPINGRIVLRNPKREAKG